MSDADTVTAADITGLNRAVVARAAKSSCVSEMTKSFIRTGSPDMRFARVTHSGLPPK